MPHYSDHLFSLKLSTMDLPYASALRNATNAWGNNRTTDALTLQDLKRRKTNDLDDTQIVQGTEAAEDAALQPQLARFGSLGTSLNIFA